MSWKKFYKFSVSILTLTLTMQIPTTLFANSQNLSYPSTVTNVTSNSAFTISSGTITSYDKTKDSNFPNVIIPSTINNEKVTTIGDKVFNHIGVKSVIIPDGVTTIGNFAFNGNQISELSLPSSVTAIESYAFNGNDLTNLTLPEGIVIIGQSAFGFNHLTHVTFPNSLRAIGISAFALNDLEKVDLNLGLISIGKNAFASNHIVNMKLPPTVKQLGEGIVIENSVWITADEVSNFNYANKTVDINWHQFMIDHGLLISQFSINSTSVDTNDVVAPVNVTTTTQTLPITFTDYTAIAYNKERTLFSTFETSSTNGTVTLSEASPVRFRNNLILMDIGSLTPVMNIQPGYSIDFASNVHAFDMHDGIVPYTITANGKPITTTATLAPGSYNITFTATDSTPDSIDDTDKETTSRSITVNITDNKYIINFDTNGALQNISNQSVAQNGLVKLPTTPVKDGYVFDGWYSDSNLTNKWNFYTNKINKNTTLYAKWIQQIYLQEEYIYGYPDGSVRPDANISRGEIVAIIARLLPPYNTTTNYADYFTDVQSTDFFYNNLNELMSLGIIEKSGNTLFEETTHITREQFVELTTKMVTVTQKLVAQTGAIIKADASDGENVYINYAYDNEYIQDYTKNNFVPDELITRAEAILILNEVTNRQPDKASINKLGAVYTDLAPNYWAYYDIMEATIAHECIQENNNQEWIKTLK